jgi:PAS domain S-box-containing protein
MEETLNPVEHDFLAGDGEMATLMRALDWSSTPLGPPETWPQSLKTIVRIILTSRFAMWMGWGPELTFFYNDAYISTLVLKHPSSLGKPVGQVWEEIWSQLFPRIDTVLKTGVATWDEGLLLFLERSGFPEETYHTFSYSPVSDDDGQTAGILCVVAEESDRVIGERRVALLGEIASALSPAKSECEVLETLKEKIEKQPQDLPFALFYLFDHKNGLARLATSIGIAAGEPGAPNELSLTVPDQLWQADKIALTGQPIKIDDLQAILPNPPKGNWDRSPREATVVPIFQQTQDKPAGFLVAGLNPFQTFGPKYSTFLELLVGQIAASLSNVHAYAEERRRTEELAKLDQAKTLFFSNISHELRTPLTLMLGPIEESVQSGEGAHTENLQIAHRNGLRLLKLVNNLLDFSRIEAGRMTARFERVDLPSYTSQLASNFRAAAEKAAIRFVVDCQPLASETYVDYDMWEKIVLNLISNSLKTTFEGEIRVTLNEEGSPNGRVVVLRVTDTGTGIPQESLPHLFERFYRVEDAKSRTHEGTGIGLALVKELVQLHQGQVSVQSVLGQGTTFSVTLPVGREHLPPDRTFEQSERASSSSSGVLPFVTEALRWNPSETIGGDSEVPSSRAKPESSPKILIADDNADMREYLARILGATYSVETTSDGESALVRAKANRPDLILSDVMMPQLDGFGLISRVREDEDLREIPIILLSARAGEEAKLEGLRHGADDYLVKPFSARELLARIQSVLALDFLRRETREQETRLRLEAEKAKESLEVVLHGIRDYFVHIDRNWNCTFASESVCRLLNMSDTEIQGASFWNICAPEMAGPLRAAMEKALAENEPTSLELYDVRFDRWFEERIYPAPEGGITLLAIDITERIITQTILRESKERLQRFAQDLPLIAWECTADGVVEWINPRFSEYTGMASDSPSTIAWRDVIDPSDLGGLYEGWRTATKDGKEFDVELRLRRFDGAMRWWLIRIAPVLDASGEIQRWYGSAADIQDQKEVEQELEARVEARTGELLEANREMEGFTYSVSHDLRTPLRSIVFNSGLLLDEFGHEMSEEPKQLLRRQGQSAMRLAKLIDDLLKLSRITRQEMTLERVNLSLIARQVVDQIPHDSTKFEVVIQPEMIAYADPQLIQFVISNLFENAVKFSPAGGCIEIGKLREATVDTFFVKDQGVGFDPKYAQKIFEAFERLVTDAEFPGTGIGLANVKRIVERHKGKVWADSVPGSSATFYFTLGSH